MADEQHLLSTIAPLREQLRSHPLYVSVATPQRLRVLLRSHVFCVWDFQSLLTALQRKLTCVEVPWMPHGDPQSRRLINEIVLEEESDDAPWGGYCSHFELYLRAMEEAKADTTPIREWLKSLRAGGTVADTLSQIELPPGVAKFLRHTFDVLERGNLVEVTATFTYGREDIIPAMFERFVAELDSDGGGHWSYFLSYLRRHIECDGERHGPMSRQLLRSVCHEDPILWHRATQAAEAALLARLELWREIMHAIPGGAVT